MTWSHQFPLTQALLGLGIVFGAAGLAYLIARYLVLGLVLAVIRRTRSTWDDALAESGTFARLVALAPLLVVEQGLAFVTGLSEGLATLLHRLTIALMIMVVVRGFTAATGGLNAIYNRYPRAKDRPIKGIVQVVNILAWLAATILMIAVLIDESPVLLLSGLGALTAVGMLVFRDSLLSLVAGVQITTNGLIRMDDWIEMPQFNADGFVIDIALNTVQVQNWDKTITSIPTHKFLENSFKNWRGMFESGGRRIKRSINLDLSSIRFLSDEEVDRFGDFKLLREYIAEKKEEIAAYNREHPGDPSLAPNVRRLTNVGTYRRYVTNYVRQHPGINQEMILLIRQLQPTAEGLPLEVYLFTKDVRWVYHEGVQADIFDHLLAVVPSFGLRVFQSPSGADLRQLGGGSIAAENRFVGTIDGGDRTPASRS